MACFPKIQVKRIARRFSPRIVITPDSPKTDPCDDVSTAWTRSGNVSKSRKLPIRYFANNSKSRTFK